MNYQYHYVITNIIMATLMISSKLSGEGGGGLGGPLHF